MPFVSELLNDAQYCEIIRSIDDNSFEIVNREALVRVWGLMRGREVKWDSFRRLLFRYIGVNLEKVGVNRYRWINGPKPMETTTPIQRPSTEQQVPMKPARRLLKQIHPRNKPMDSQSPSMNESVQQFQPAEMQQKPIGMRKIRVKRLNRLDEISYDEQINLANGLPKLTPAPQWYIDQVLKPKQLENSH